MSLILLEESAAAGAPPIDEFDVLVSGLAVRLADDVAAPWAMNCPECGSTNITQYQKKGVQYWHCNACGYDTGPGM